MADFLEMIFRRSAPKGNYDPKAAAAAQATYCETEEIPMFAPADGVCYRCGRNIFLPTNGSHGAVYGITVEEAGSTLITGCPHCNYSFVE